ncbi:MAG: hypothetical protein SGILL_003795, partial [Bacillariaceae sp.]
MVSADDLQQQRQRQRCAPTETVQLSFTTSNHKNKKHPQPQPQLRLHSLDLKKRPKSVGGDEYYVAIYRKFSSSNPDLGLAATDALQAVAIVNDLADGTYDLEFVVAAAAVSPGFHDDDDNDDNNNSGHRETAPVSFQLSDNMFVQVYLQYTCGMGSMDPPAKDSWKTTGGHLAVSFEFELPRDAVWSFPMTTTSRGVLMPRDDASSKATASTTCCCWRDLDRVLVFGDSLMKHLVDAIQTDDDDDNNNNNNVQRNAYADTMMRMHDQYHIRKKTGATQTKGSRSEPTVTASEASSQHQSNYSQQDESSLPIFYFPTNVNAPLNNHTWATKWVPEFQKFYGHKSLDNIMTRRRRQPLEHLVSSDRRQQMVQQQPKAASWAILVGSSTWDLLEPVSYTETGHLDGIRNFLNFLQDDFVPQQQQHFREQHEKDELSSNAATTMELEVAIVWKSPTAMHVHRTYDSNDIAADRLPGLPIMRDDDS